MKLKIPQDKEEGGGGGGHGLEGGRSTMNSAPQGRLKGTKGYVACALLYIYFACNKK